MATDRAILCGPVRHSPLPVVDQHPVMLDIYGRKPNVLLRLEEVRHALWADIPACLRDLLDIALYVYSADAATRRSCGAVDGEEIGRGWRRKLHLRVAVREPDRWTALRDRLAGVLSYLTDDTYHFEFERLTNDRSLDGFIDFERTRFDGDVKEVVMFSGGLDSLAGAVQEAVTDKRQVLLVHHRSTSKRATRHERLVKALQEREDAVAPLHFAVWANKDKGLGREYTQRSRSLLFAALGAMFAAMIGLNRVRFYENGVVSLNLPLSPQVVGGRASRTTHPRVLDGFGGLVTELVGRPFTFENPFVWETKAQIVERIVRAECGDLIAHTTSCAHTWEQTTEHPHCGACSQCIDRRFAVLAAGMGEHDPATGYRTDLLIGARPEHDAKTMVTAFVEQVERVERMDAAGFLTCFGEVARVLRHGGGGADEVALRVYRLYKRHAEHVRQVLNWGIKEHADAIARRALPPDCLLRLVYDGGDGPTANTPPPQVPEGNYFIRRGPGWAIRFGAPSDNYFHDDVGFEYLRILFEKPGATISAAALASRVELQRSAARRAATVGEAAAAGVGHGAASPSAGDAALDDEALIALTARLEELKELREDAEASESPRRLEMLDEITNEERQLRAQLAKDRGRRGKKRTLGDVRNQVRNRVGVAVRRAIKKIKKYDTPLAEHLHRPRLLLGYSLTYNPGAGVTWTVTG
jgi:hypothetical protein